MPCQRHHSNTFIRDRLPPRNHLAGEDICTSPGAVFFISASSAHRDKEQQGYRSARESGLRISLILMSIHSLG